MGCKIVFAIILILAACYQPRLEAQPVLNFPNGIRITVNDSLYHVNQSFLDSLRLCYDQSRFLYHIAGVHFDSQYTFTSMRLPQTLGQRELMKQIILYYNFLGDETKRRFERILIFPFFVPLKEPAPVSCRYRDGLFRITILHWQQVPIPPMPSPEDREIYNQIINHTLEVSNTLDEIDKRILMDTAEENNLTLDEVLKIYQDVLLWQRSR